MSTSEDISKKLLWTVDDVAFMMSCHKNTIWNRVREGIMPKPIKWQGKTLWRRAAIESYVDQLAD